MKKRKYRVWLIAFFILLVMAGVELILITRMRKTSPRTEQTVTVKQDPAARDQMKQQEDTIRKEKADRWLESLRDSVEAYPAFLENDQTVTGFYDWLQKDPLFINGLDKAFEAESPEKGFYQIFGKSLLVKMDEFLGIRDYPEFQDQTGDGADLTFAGDLCLAEDGFVLDYYDTTSGLTDCISPALIGMTNQADFFMINNEFCISDRGMPLEGKYYTFRAMPERTGILKELGTDLVSLANNHVYDYGKEAFGDTLSCLKQADISYVGGGRDRQEAEKTFYFEVGGMKLGILSASRAEKYRFTPAATEEDPGIFLMYDPERLLEVARDASSRCDYLIAYIHWGTEDSKYYEDYQHELAVSIFDAGVDAVIGGHPHVLQGVEYIEDQPVVYSLGDFWFNDENKYTALLTLHLDFDGLTDMTITPCRQHDYTTTLLEEAGEREAFFRYVRDLSHNCVVSDDGKITP